MFEKNEVHVMVDLETLSLRPDAAIVSIGAVKFDPLAQPGKLAHESIPTFPSGVSSTFYMIVDSKDLLATANEFHVDPDTVRWWMQQPEEARAVFWEERSSLKHVLEQFNQWYKGATCIWAAPATFDVPILEHAYRRAGWSSAPWAWSDVRCYRTFRKMAEGFLGDDIRMGYVDPKIEHHALYDAMEQAHNMQILACAMYGQGH